MIRALIRIFNRQFRDAETADVLAILVAISFIALAFSALANVFSQSIDWFDWAEATLQNFSTEIFGAIATYALFELVIGRRNEQRRFMTQMRSPDVATALTALEHLRANNGLFDGSLNNTDLRGLQLPKADMKNALMQAVNLDQADLHEADFSKAVLEGASMREANLSEVNFWLANLQGSDMQDAELEGADLRLADVQGALLRRANLKNARLFQAKLEGADFANANLENAILGSANLHGANLTAAKINGVHFDPNTILPDGTAWTAQTDMRRFTFSQHPTFWKQSEDGEGHTTTSLKKPTETGK